MEELQQRAQSETQAKRAHQRHEHREGVTRRARTAGRRRLDFDRVAAGSVGGLGRRGPVTLFQVGGTQLRLPGRVEGGNNGGTAVPRTQVPQVVLVKNKTNKKKYTQDLFIIDGIFLSRKGVRPLNIVSFYV